MCKVLPIFYAEVIKGKIGHVRCVLFMSTPPTLESNKFYNFHIYNLQDVRTKKKLSSSELRLRQKKTLHIISLQYDTCGLQIMFLLYN